MLVKWDHFSKVRGENKTYLKPPPRVGSKRDPYVMVYEIIPKYDWVGMSSPKIITLKSIAVSDCSLNRWDR